MTEKKGGSVSVIDLARLRILLKQQIKFSCRLYPLVPSHYDWNIFCGNVKQQNTQTD